MSRHLKVEGAGLVQQTTFGLESIESQIVNPSARNRNWIHIYLYI